MMGTETGFSMGFLNEDVLAWEIDEIARGLHEINPQPNSIREQPLNNSYLP